MESSKANQSKVLLQHLRNLFPASFRIYSRFHLCSIPFQVNCLQTLLPFSWTPVKFPGVHFPGVHFPGVHFPEVQFPEVHFLLSGVLHHRKKKSGFHNWLKHLQIINLPVLSKRYPENSALQWTVTYMDWLWFHFPRVHIPGVHFPEVIQGDTVFALLSDFRLNIHQGWT